MEFPPAVVAYIDQKRLLAHQDRAEAAFAALVSMGFLADYNGASVLDIGCGLALMDVLLWRGCGFKSIYLLDGDGTGEQRTGFKENTKAWANVKLGEAMVLANVSPDTVTVHSMVAGFLPPVLPQIDLVISLRSWGHHYPISVYLDLVKGSLKRTGLVITDIRNGTGGAEVLTNAGFDFICRVPDPSHKCQRLVFRRK